MTEYVGDGKGIFVEDYYLYFVFGMGYIYLIY